MDGGELGPGGRIGSTLFLVESPRSNDRGVVRSLVADIEHGAVLCQTLHGNLWRGTALFRDV